MKLSNFKQKQKWIKMKQDLLRIELEDILSKLTKRFKNFQLRKKSTTEWFWEQEKHMTERKMNENEAEFIENWIRECLSRLEKCFKNSHWDKNQLINYLEGEESKR